MPICDFVRVMVSVNVFNVLVPLVAVFVVEVPELDTAIVLVLKVSEVVAVPVCVFVRVIVEDIVLVNVVVLAVAVSDAVLAITVLLWVAVIDTVFVVATDVLVLDDKPQASSAKQRPP